MDIQVNTIYLIDAKILGSKQCRYEIEATGMLPDEPTIREKKRRHAGNLGTGLGLWLAKHFDESVALDVL